MRMVEHLAVRSRVVPTATPTIEPTRISFVHLLHLLAHHHARRVRVDAEPPQPKRDVNEDLTGHWVVDQWGEFLNQPTLPAIEFRIVQARDEISGRHGLLRLHEQHVDDITLRLFFGFLRSF